MESFERDKWSIEAIASHKRAGGYVLDRPGIMIYNSILSTDSIFCFNYRFKSPYFSFGSTLLR